ncbi:hypothetical protein [Rhodococcus opacus]|uniref:hypothetical protein n=1 Tax=Rhodococcus opacus TaxID=37919 RepID=UPI002475D7CD|nr:hypothetical protein [Rhodococcus opacus]MDH6291005.1 hypothetical protein [Rhodococcus opacus]
MRNTTPNAVPVTIDAPAATTIAAVSPAYRPTAVESISSARPDSSSARVCRITVKITATAITVYSAPAFQIATAPGLGLNMGPYMAIWAGLAAVAAANSAVDLTVQHAAVDHDIRDAGDVVQVARVAE